MPITFVGESHVDSSSSNSQTPEEPVGAQDGDFALMFGGLDTTGSAWTDPADFNETDTHEDGGAGSDVYSCYVGWKIRGADAGSGYNLSNAGAAAQMHTHLLLFRGVDPLNPFDVVFNPGSHQVNYDNDVTSAAAPITIVTANAWVILLQHWSSSVAGFTLVPPDGYTSRSEVLQASRVGFIVSKEIAVPGTETPGVWNTTGSVSAHDSSNWTLALRPAGAASIARLARYYEMMRAN